MTIRRWRSEKVAEEWRLSTQAAVGKQVCSSSCLGLRYWLENIYFNEKNSTRFIIVVTNQRIFRKGANEDQHLFRDTAFERFSV